MQLAQKKALKTRIEISVKTVKSLVLANINSARAGEAHSTTGRSDTSGLCSQAVNYVQLCCFQKSLRTLYVVVSACMVGLIVVWCVSFKFSFVF